MYKCGSSVERVKRGRIALDGRVTGSEAVRTVMGLSAEGRRGRVKKEVIERD